MTGNHLRQTEALGAAEAGIKAALPWLDAHYDSCEPGLLIATGGFGPGVWYSVNITDCLAADGRIVLRSNGSGSDGTARRSVEVIYVPPLGALPGRYDAWREIVQ